MTKTEQKLTQILLAYSSTPFVQIDSEIKWTERGDQFIKAILNLFQEEKIELIEEIYHQLTLKHARRGTLSGDAYDAEIMDDILSAIKSEIQEEVGG